MIDDDSDQTWALAWFVPEMLGTAQGGLAPRMTAALDVSDIEAIVRKHLLIAFAIVCCSTVLSLAIGWRLASRMSRALSRVNFAMRRLKDQEYVKVVAVKTGDEGSKILPTDSTRWSTACASATGSYARPWVST